MDFCEDIRDAKKCYGNMAACYASDLIFGRNSDEKFFNLLRLSIYIKTLERNIPIKKKIYEPSSLQGQAVDFSSLKRQNNTLILDTERSINCTVVEINPCLSDDEICSIIERIKILCNECIC